MGQCVYYHHARAVIARLYPEHAHNAELPRLIDHITEFSLAALRALGSAQNHRNEARQA
jgi:hypothetical protein